MSKIPGPDSWVWRFVAGQPLDGRYRTDAKFFRRGRKALGPVAPGRWSYLAGGERLAVRLGVLCGVPAAGWEYWTHPTRTTILGAFLGVLGALWGVWRLREGWRRRRVYRRYILPLHRVLEPLLGLPATARPREYIAVPETWATAEETPVRIGLPPEFNSSPAAKRLVADAAMSKFPRMTHDNTDAIFQTVGRPVLLLKMAPQPPDLVIWAEHADTIRALPPGKTFVGLGARNKPYIHDWNSGELVHFGVSVNTGGGKSNAIVGWLAQELRKGASATFIDPKHSFLPEVLQGHPRFTLANDPDDPHEFWDKIFAFEREMDRRGKIIRKDRTQEFPLAFLVLDELSEFADISSLLWEAIKADPEPFGYDPVGKKAPSPLWRSLSRILRMGREFYCRVIVLTQRLDNKSTGGIGLRDLFGTRALGKFRKNQWMMLDGSTPVPKSINKIGRWIYTDTDSYTWIQNVYGEPEELRDWAFAEIRAIDTQDDTRAGDDLSPGDESVSVECQVRGNEAGAEYVGLTVSQFRNARRMRGPIPGETYVGRSPVWTREALERFFELVPVKETDPPPGRHGGGSVEG